MMKLKWLITALALSVALSLTSCTGEDTTGETDTAAASESVADTVADTTLPDETEAETKSETETSTETVPVVETVPESETVVETPIETKPAACAHEYGAWSVLDMTFHERRCALCDEQGVSKHNWEAGDVANGQTPYTCTDCGAEKLEGEYIPETEPPAPLPYDPVFMVDAEGLVPDFSVDSTQHITSAEQVENHVHIVPTIGDPYYVPFGQITGGRYVAIKYRTDNAEGMALQFYMASTGAGPVDDSTMMRAPIEGDGEWHVALFDTQPLMDAGHYDGSYVSYFRFDPMDCEYKLDETGEPYQDENDLWVRHEMPVGAYIDIEYIAFFESEEHYTMYENRPTHFVTADTLMENASVAEDLSYNQFMHAAMGEGYITLTGTDTDAYVTAILPGTTDAVTTKYLFIKYRTTHKDLLGQVFTGSGMVWEGDQNKLNFPYEGDGEWHLLMVDLTPNETLTGNAGFLRYDFFQYGADPDTKEERSIDVQYLAFFESAEEAAAFDAAYDVVMAG